MANDPILDAIRGKSASGAGGVAVADEEDDPILTAIRGPQAAPSKPIIPFASPLPQTPPPVGPLAGTLGPQPPIDATKIPLSPFTNRYINPEAPEMVRAENAAEDEQRARELRERAIYATKGLTPEQVAAHDQESDKILEAISSGPKRLPIPTVTGLGGPFSALTAPSPTGKPHIGTVPLGEVAAAKEEFLNNPSIPKTPGQAFFAGAGVDALKNINDMFLSPIGLVASSLGLTETMALARASKFGPEAAKLAQDYEAMRNAGASGAELADVEQKMKAAIATAAKAQKAAVVAGKAGVGVGAGFGAQGAMGVAKGIEDKSSSEVLGGLGQIALGGAGVVGASRAGGIEEQVKAHTAEAVREATAGQEVTARRTPQVPAEAERPPEAPQLGTPGPTVGAGETTVPEKPETLAAQTDALAKGTSKIVYFPKGSKTIPAPPEDANVTIVKGNKPGAGTYYHDDSITPADIRKAVKNGTYGELLGNVQTKEEANAGKPGAVVARVGENGTEAKAAVTDVANPAAVAAQSAELQRQFPEAKVSVEKPQQVIAERQAPATLETAKAALDEQLKPWTQRLEERRASLQTVIDNPNTTAEARTAAEEEMRQMHGQRRKQDIGPPEGQAERRLVNEKPQPGQAARLPEKIKAEPEANPWSMARIQQEVDRIGTVTDKGELQRISGDKTLPLAVQTAAQKQLLGPGHAVPRTPHEHIMRAMDRQELSAKVDDLKARVAAGEEIPADEVSKLQQLTESVESAAAPTAAHAEEPIAAEAAKSGEERPEHGEPARGTAGATEGGEGAHEVRAKGEEHPEREGTEAGKPAESTVSTKPESLKFREGDRVMYAATNGKKFTGTIRSIEGENATIDVDQQALMRIPGRKGGVPLGRVETVALNRLVPEQQDAASKEAEEKPNVESVGARSEAAPTKVPPENGERAAIAGEARGVGAERGGQGEGTVRPSGIERHGAERGTEAGEGGTPVPAERGGPAAPGRERPASRSSELGNDYRITEADHIGEGGVEEKFRLNVAAIRILKELEAAGRNATPEEQSQLVRYSGWGWSGNLLNEYHDKWVRQRAELKKLLAPEEYDSAKRSTTNAHYTSPEVIRSVWDAVRRLGFGGGRILEPSAGIGHFLGLMPDDLFANSKKTAIELDQTSGKILRQLYQTADVRIQGFQELRGLNDFYDLAISNVPFGDYGVNDPAYKGKKYLTSAIHNYFIARMLDKVRPGGLAVIITSHHSLDTYDSRARQEFAKRGDMLGAIRLPGGAFEKNAGTEVTTDVLFFRRRTEDEKPAGRSFVESKPMELPGGTARINEYFHDNPGMALGQHSLEGTMYRGGEYKLQPTKGDLGEKLAAAIEKLPENAMRERVVPQSVTKAATVEDIPDFGDTKPWGLKVTNDKVFRNLDGKLVHQPDYPETAIEPLKGMLLVRDLTRELFQAEGKGRPGKELTAARGRLNRSYDAFVKAFGYLNQPKNVRIMHDDPDGPLLLALEKWDAKAKTAAKADVFFKQTIAPRKEVTSVSNVADALPASLAEKGKIDFGYMSKISGRPDDEIKTELRAAGLAFQTPQGHWETKDEYLSGDVRAKLRDAEEAAKLDKTFTENVEALKRVQPRDLEPGEISVRLGTPWIPEQDVADFIDEAILGQQRYGYKTKVVHVQSEALWRVENRGGFNEAAQTKWGTARVKPMDLIEGALNLKRPTVYDDLGEGKKAVNEKETLAAREKLEQIEEEFGKWVFKDADRAERLTKYYNENHNNIVDRDYDGSHLTLPGKSAGIVMRPHQLNAIWRSLAGGNTLFAHVVGAGKTFTIIGSAMEKRRLGLAKKPMIVVPNHLVEQWGGDFLKLYPQARVLAATKDDFEAKNRKKVMSQIATGDWDAVIVPHASFGLLPVGDEIFERYAKPQLDMIEEHIRDLSAEGGQANKRTVKQLEKAKERIKVRLERARNKERKDNTINFEDTGVDALYVDEAHMYKNLFFPTKMGNINGIPKSDAQRAFDMYMKSKYVSDLNNGGNVSFATGTPISNTMAEIYTMMRYLDEGRLSKNGMEHFDAWAAAFGNTVQNMEVSPEDPTRFRVSTRFAKFINVPELKRMFRQSADVIHPEDLEGIVKVPDIEGGKPKVIEVPASQRVLDYIQELGKRATAIRKKEVRPDEDNMLKITSEGRKVALDYRSMFPGAGDDGESKIAAAAKRIAAIYDETRSTKRTQAVMLDLMTPSDAAKKRGQFNAYSDLKNKLVGLGVPADQIAFIHDAKSDAAKQNLFDRVNSGDVAVILGSSDKMGVGTNIQERLIALHHVDAPWRPSDIEQREGRIIRQGNTNPAVQIYRYVTQGTFDAYMWSTISRKASFIKEMMQHGYDQRELEDADGATLSYAEAAAIATGDKRVLEKVQTDADVDRLQKLKSIHEQSLTTNRVKLAQIPQRISGLEASRDAIKADIKLRDANKSDEFKMTVGKKTYTDRKDAGAALNAAIEANRGSSRMKVGTFNGFDIEADGSGNPYLYGSASHGFNVNHESPLGTIQSAERNLDTMENFVAARDEDIKALQRDMEARKAEIEKPFAKQAQLDRLLAKQKELNDALAVNKEDKTMAGADENQVFDENFKTIDKPEPTPEAEDDKLIRDIASGQTLGMNLPIQVVYRLLSSLIRKALGASRPAERAATVERPPEEQKEKTEIPKRPAERAGNIRLDKLNAPEDVINEIRRSAKDNAAEFNEQRRGKIPFKETRGAAEKLVEEGMFTEADLKKIKAGTALNAEELLAARGMLIESARKVREAAAAVRTNGNVDNVLAFQEALLRHDGIQKAVSGAAAEAGRALSQQRMVANALKEKKTNHEKVLDALGGKELSQEAARRLAEIPADDPVAMVKFLRSQKHWTTTQKIEAYWIANILSSPRTPIKKVLGDTVLAAAESGRRFVDVPIDKILAAIQGRKSEGSLREALTTPIAYISAMPEGLRKAAQILIHGFDLEDPLSTEMPLRFEFPGGVKNPWNMPGRALSAATKLFQVMAFQGELHAQAVRAAVKEGLKDGAITARAAELVQNPTEQIIGAAQRVAEFQTYTESPDQFARWLMAGRDRVMLPKGIPLIGGLHPLKFVIPFIQIPYNLTKQAVRYSPFGAARLNDWEHAKSPEATKTISRALIGTAIMGALALLAAKKLLTGAAPSSPAARDEFYRSGKQPYSIKIGDRWISYKAAGPFALTAAAVAAWHDRHEQKSTMPLSEEIWAFAGAMGQALADESFLRGLKNILDAIQDPQRGAGRWVSGTVGGFVPMESALRTVGDALDPTIRDAKTITERIQSGLPIVSKNLPPKLDVLGRPATKEGSSGLAAFFPGGFAKDVPKSSIDAELDRLNKLGLKNVGFGGKTMTVDGYKMSLTDDEWTRYQKLRGTYLQSYLRQTFNAPEYKQMADEDKVTEAEDAIHQAERDAREAIGETILAERLNKVQSARLPKVPPKAMAATPQGAHP